jgi:hypothetical protein
MTDNAYTLLPYDTEEFDIGGFYDATTNFRFQPPPGKYVIGGESGSISTIADQQLFAISLYKNGSLFKVLQTRAESGAAATILGGCALVEANGTDYFDLRFYQNTGADRTITGSQSQCYIYGNRVNEGN